MKRMHSFLVLLAVGCGGGSSGSTDDDTDDGSESVDDDDGGPATAPGDDDDADDDDGPGSSTDDGESTTDTPADTGTDSTEGGDSSSTDDSTTGGPVNDCTSEKDPCVLELDTAAAGAGGVDQFFVYTVGDGTEHVEFTGIELDYVSWDVTPWSFLCNIDGPCCQSDGATTCDKPLVQESLDLGPGDTAYVFVFANAPYELTITSG